LCPIPVATSIAHGWKGGGVGYLTEEHAYKLALRITRTSGYNVVEVRRAWSAMWAWHVEAEDRRTGERLLLLSEDQFDNRLAADRPTIAQPITAQVAPVVKRAAAHHS